jgi:SAM-dependent methyltransferase
MPAVPGRRLLAYFYCVKHNIFKADHSSIIKYQKQSNIDRSDMSTHPDFKVIKPGGHLVSQLCFSTEWRVDVDLLSPDDFIQEFTGSGHDNVVPDYVHALTHKQPDLKIIELGSAVSGCAGRILERLRKHPEIGVSGPRFGEYHISEPSGELLQIARENLKDWENLILFRQLDVQKDLAAQGFVESHYDLAVITIHDNDDSKSALQCLRKLLRPQGQLIIVDRAQQTARNHISNWNDLLGEYGFAESKFQWSTQHCPHAADHNWRIAIAAVAEEEQDSRIYSTHPAALLLIEPEQGSQIADLMLQGMKTQIPNASVSRISIDRISDTTGSVCIFLIESEESILPAISETQWESIKQVISQAKDVLWIGRGGAVGSPSPESNLVVGMGRTIRTEKPSSRFVTVDLETDDSPEQAANAISKVLCHTMMCQVQSKQNHDSEYALREGRVFVPRIVPDTQINNYIAEDLTAKSPLKFDQHASYLLVGGLGGLGRSISIWMASNGAKHLMFMSRSGTEKPEAQKTVNELKAMGVHVTVCKCDVGDSASLEATIQQYRKDFPPIKGLIHGGMVLRVSNSFF